MNLKDSLERMDDMIGTLTRVKGDKYTRIVVHAASIRALLDIGILSEAAGLVVSTLMVRAVTDLMTAYDLEVDEVAFNADVAMLAKGIVAKNDA